MWLWTSFENDSLYVSEPEQILLYASAGSGDIGFRWLNGASTPDTYIIGHSYRPVAVGYDPIDKAGRLDISLHIL